MILTPAGPSAVGLKAPDRQEPREDSAGLADDFSSVQTFAHTTMLTYFEHAPPNMVYYFCK